MMAAHYLVAWVCACSAVGSMAWGGKESEVVAAGAKCPWGCSKAKRHNERETGKQVALQPVASCQRSQSRLGQFCVYPYIWQRLLRGSKDQNLSLGGDRFISERQEPFRQPGGAIPSYEEDIAEALQ